MHEWRFQNFEATIMKMKTWTNYTKNYFRNSSIDTYGAASLSFLGQAHVIFAANKTATFRSPNLRRKGLLGIRSTTIPMAGRTPTFFLLKYPP